MAAMDDPTILGARGVMVYMGLGTPASRAFVAASLAGVLAYITKTPAAAFDDKGEMRPFKGISRAPTATYTHFLAVPVIAGAAAYVFT